MPPTSLADEMSGSQKPQESAAPAAAGDPSMEDILASIRRILSEDEVQPPEAKSAEPQTQAHSADEGVLVLDPAMMVQEPPPTVVEPARQEPLPPAVTPPPEPTAPVQSLVAPEAAAAAVASVGNLVRTLAAERTMQVRGGGPTIEDIVREELRPLLKEWLDTNLPALVERLVRAEIERVVGRAVP